MTTAAIENASNIQITNDYTSERGERIQEVRVHLGRDVWEARLVHFEDGFIEAYWDRNGEQAFDTDTFCGGVSNQDALERVEQDLRDIVSH